MLSLISQTLIRVREQGLSKHWMAKIIQLLAGEPWSLPIRRDLLSQAGREIYHPHPDRITLGEVEFECFRSASVGH